MLSRLTVIVSGCHSGPNPSPGLGIATSLRQAFPDIRLIGRDFSPMASGLHAGVFDKIWVCPPWKDSDLELAWQQIECRLPDAWMIPGLDLEVRWLARFAHPRILAPSVSALDQVGKPAFPAASRLSVRIPQWLPLHTGDCALDRFCRGHGWRVWLKGPAYEARRTGSWPELQRAAKELSATWGEDGLFVQGHVDGVEISMAFAAYAGELLDAVLLEKCAVTAEGKVWGGNFGEIPRDLLESLRRVLRDLHWTGGGELELIRDARGALWLFDWNPRFPAWIHGATLGGYNLPAALLGRAVGRSFALTNPSDGFMRVVVEVPARSRLPAPFAANLLESFGGKHPSDMPHLGRRLDADRPHRRLRSVEVLPADLIADLREAAARLEQTPQRVTLPCTAAARFGVARSLRTTSQQVAYSVKTNPDPLVMVLARNAGLLAEVISREEMEWAMCCGWGAGDIIYNGPAPLASGPRARGSLGAVFADDCPTLAAYLGAPPARVVGVRLRPPFVRSRFGVPLDQPEEFSELASLFEAAPPAQPLGLSLHVASSDIGLERWEQLATVVIDFAGTLEELSGRAVSLVDLGGGWSPEDIDQLGPVLERLRSEAMRRLRGHPDFVIEPGKVIVEPIQALLTRIVHIRRNREGRRSAVLDAGINQMPRIHDFPHRLALLRGDVAPLAAGRDELMGPTCMEADRIAEEIALPEEVRVGDIIAICDVGAYDASMAYAFGRGGVQ